MPTVSDEFIKCVTTELSVGEKTVLEGPEDSL